MPDGKKKLLLVGSNGMLAQKISSSAPQEYELVCVDLPELDITDKVRVLAYIGELNPDVIINCAAYTNVDGCETEQALANRVNGSAVGFLAEAAKEAGAVLVHISTDYVFGGEKNRPYVEDDHTNAQSAYGRSKVLGEQAVLSSNLEEFYIVRSGWLFGPGGNNFVETIIRLSKERTELGIVNDQLGTPTYTGDLADAIFNILKSSSPYGIFHFSSQGQCSWYEFANKIIALARKNGEQLKVKTINPIKTEEYPLPAVRPKYSVLSKEKYLKEIGHKIPSWEEGLAKYFTERQKIVS